MIMSTQIIDDGFVLHRFSYRETSVIVECFLQHHGRISFIAKGVRTERSRLKGLLQAFLPLHMIATGKSQLKTLSLIEPCAKPIILEKMSLMCAWYVNELLVRLLPKEESNPRLYFIYHATLLALEQAKGNATSIECQQALRLFEKNLLEALGYQLPLMHEANSGHVIIYDHYYRFLPEHGFVHVAQQEGADIFLGEDLQAIAHDQFSNLRVLHAAKRLLRLAIRPLLGGKPLKTRELFEKISINTVS